MADSEARTRVGRAVAAAVALLLLAELVAQVIVYAYSGEPFKSLSLYRWSAYGLVRNNPDLTSPAFKINANGFRAVRDFQKQKPKGTYRVMLLGGSVLYSGVGGAAWLSQYGRVKSGETISDYLEKRMATDPAFAGSRVEVINTAVNFNRITETSAALLADYIQWQPDYVVVFGTVNNFMTPRHMGDFEKGATVLQSPHPWHAEFDRLVVDTGASSTLERLWRTGSEHSAALALGSKVAIVVADRLVSLTARLAPVPNAVGPLPHETDDERARYFALYVSYADAMVAAARAQRAGIAFAWEPMLSDGIKALSAEEKTIYPAVRRSDDDAAQYEAARQLFIAHFAKSGVPIFDPTAALGAYDKTVFIDYAHYTAEGNRYIADQLYADIGADMRARITR